MKDIGLRVADHIDAMLAYWDKNQVCRFANNAYVEWFGKSRENMVDKMTLKELLGPLYEMNLPYINGVLQGQPQQFERDIRIPSGTIKTATASYYPDISHGDVQGFFVHVTDISDNKKLELELKASEMKFKGLLESAPDSIVIVNSDGIIEIVNALTEKQFGYCREDLLGKAIEMLIPERYRESHIGHRLQYASSPNSRGMGTGLELFGLHKNGKEIPVEISISPINLPDGVFVSVAIRDISWRKQAEIEIKTGNERNRIFIEQSPNALAMFDLEMHYMAASGKWMEDYHLQGKEIIGHSHYEIFPEIGEDWKAIHRACLRGETNHCDEAMFERADGSAQWITWDVRPWYISAGKVGGLLMYTADITNVKSKEREKLRIEAILDKTNEVARIGTWEMELKTGILKWSGITKQIHEVPGDYTPDLNTAINFYKAGESRDLIQNAIKKAIDHHIPFDLELELVTAKSNSVWVRAIGQAEFKDGVCKTISGIFQDINEIKSSKEALNKLNEELKTILNAGYVAIIGTDSEGIITHFNRGAEALLQYSASELIGIRNPMLLHVNEEVIERGKALSQKFEEKITGFDVLVKIPRQDLYESREWTYVRKDGSTFPVQLVVTAIRNRQDEVTGFLGVATDISEIKKAEKELKALHEITSDQNNRLKNFAHIVSHNLRSHSGNIDMLLDLFLEKHPKVTDNKILMHIKSASVNLMETIANLNEVVLMNTALEQNLVPVRLHAAIESAINTVSQLIKNADVQINNKVDQAVTIAGIPAYTDSILLNFITNSIRYRSAERKSKIILSATLHDNYVILTIEDNGIGIDLKKNGAKLFGMYKTFHGNADARGIGLFITKNQVEAMGGKVEVESRLDTGTIFKIYLKYEKV